MTLRQLSQCLTAATDFTSYMYEYLSRQTGSGTWPAPPGQRRTLADSPVFDHTAIAEVIAITGDTRRLTHVSGGLLCAVLAGAAAVGAALLIRGQLMADRANAPPLLPQDDGGDAQEDAIDPGGRRRGRQGGAAQ